MSPGRHRLGSGELCGHSAARRPDPADDSGGAGPPLRRAQPSTAPPSSARSGCAPGLWKRQRPERPERPAWALCCPGALCLWAWSLPEHSRGCFRTPSDPGDFTGCVSGRSLAPPPPRPPRSAFSGASQHPQSEGERVPGHPRSLLQPLHDTQALLLCPPGPRLLPLKSQAPLPGLRMRRGHEAPLMGVRARLSPEGSSSETTSDHQPPTLLSLVPESGASQVLAARSGRQPPSSAPSLCAGALPHRPGAPVATARLASRRHQALLPQGPLPAPLVRVCLLPSKAATGPSWTAARQPGSGSHGHRPTQLSHLGRWPSPVSTERWRLLTRCLVRVGLAGMQPAPSYF